MTEADPIDPTGSGRLWVLFDGSPGSQAALLQALPLMQALGAELRALYIEDPALARCASLSINLEVGAVSGRLRARGPSEHRHAQAVQRQRAQVVLDHLLGTRALSLALESRPGPALEVLADLVDDQDWVVTGRSGYAGWQPTRPGSLTRSLADAPRSTLMIGSPSGRSHPGPWLLLLDDPTSTQRRLSRARDLLGPGGAELRIVCQSGSAADYATPAAPWIRQRIASGLALQALIQDQQAAGLIASADSALIRTGLAAGWLDRIDRPLLVLPEY